MCGIGGFIRRDKHVSYCEPALKDLIYFSRVRGIDALGLAKVHESSKKLEVLKEVGDPCNVIAHVDMKNFLINPGDSKYFFFHNRAATRGSKDDPGNAHPFVESKANSDHKIVMAHNGTITYNHLDQTFKGDTDSQSLAKMIASGMSIQDIEAHTHGAFALIWYDSEDHSLHFARNDQRPFGFVHSKDSLWFGSESYMVGSAIARRGFSVEKFEFLIPNQEWVWHWDSKELDKRPFPLKPKVRGNGYGNYGGKGYGYSHIPNTGGRSANTEVEEWENFMWGEAAARGNSKSTGEGEPRQGSAIINPLAPTNTGPKQTASTLYLPNKRKESLDQRYEAARAKKLRFSQVDSALGFSRNDELLITLTDWKKTERDQVALEGNVLCVGHSGQYHRLAAEVTGMVSDYTIDYVDKSKKVWKGIITNIAVAYGDHIVSTNSREQFVRFAVRQITETDAWDYTRFPDADKYENTDEVATAEVTLTPPLEPKSPSTTALQTSRDSEGEWLEAKPCFNCGEYIPKKDLHRNSRIFDGDRLVTLSLCRPCFLLSVPDVSVLNNWFEEKARDNLPVTMDPTSPLPACRKPKPFVHEAPQTQQ